VEIATFGMAGLATGSRLKWFSCRPIISIQLHTGLRNSDLQYWPWLAHVESLSGSAILTENCHDQ